MKIKDFYKYKKEFGFNAAFCYYFNNAGYKITKNIKFKQKVHNQIYNYLKAAYFSQISIDNCEIKPIEDDYKIWVFWWQGIDFMPPIVKKCYESIKQNIGSHQLIFIDKTNYSKYVKMPDYIIEKVLNGSITLTHFSDILRACLLSEYGGVWLDATIFLTKPLCEQIDGKDFYTNKFESPENEKYLSKGRWSGFFMSGCKNNPLFVNLKNLLFTYWSKHNHLVDYFIIDYFIALIYDKLNEVKVMVNSVTPNNPHIHSWAHNLFKKFDGNEYKEWMKDTTVYKMTYKFKQNLINRENTYYKKFMGEI